MLPSARHWRAYPCNLANKFNIKLVIFFSHLMVKDIHLSKKRYCNPNHCCANKKQLVKIVWFPAGNLCSVHLRGAILTWWAVKLLPGARMRGHLDQMEGSFLEQSQGLPGWSSEVLLSACSTCLHWDLVCDLGW